MVEPPSISQPYARILANLILEHHRVFALLKGKQSTKVISLKYYTKVLSRIDSLFSAPL
jgi:hypothetical protein